MKLVDILARELKVWPQGIPCLWVARGNIIIGRQGSYEYEMNGEWPIPEDRSTAIVYPTQWQAAVDALKAESSPAWAGIGLPPIGTDVEVFAAYSHPRLDRFIGQQVHIVAHDVINGDPVAVFRMPVDGDDAEQDYHAMVASSFLPIRTPEQIASDERAAAIEKMILIDEKGSLSRTHFCGLLYDAGYRKFEIVDN